MALRQGSTRIDGRPMKKRSAPYNLKTEVQRKNREEYLDYFLGIVGLAGSGRRTLAYRFANMNGGVIQDGEVPTEYFYTAILPGFFGESHDPLGPYTVKLVSYIIEPPAELPDRDPHFYWERWNDFSCMIFVFDIEKPASFHEATFKLTSYRQENYRLPRCLLVGNKSDRRDGLPREDPDDPEFCLVTEFTINMESKHLNVPYLEVSAKNGTEVNDLLFKIVDLTNIVS